MLKRLLQYEYIHRDEQRDTKKKRKEVRHPEEGGKQKGWKGGAGHPGFLVFNLSPWEAHPAPAIP